MYLSGWKQVQYVYNHVQYNTSNKLDNDKHKY